jgi:hypothetical protein
MDPPEESLYTSSLVLTDKLFEHLSKLQSIWSLVSLQPTFDGVHGIAREPCDTTSRSTTYKLQKSNLRTQSIWTIGRLICLKLALQGLNFQLPLEELEQAEVETEAWGVSKEHP